MSDAAFPTGAYPSMTISDLREVRALGTANAAQLTELARREAVAAGDMTNSTPGERLRALRAADALQIVTDRMAAALGGCIDAMTPHRNSEEAQAIQAALTALENYRRANLAA